MQFWLGDMQLEIPPSRFEHAVRLSYGPEVRALHLQLRGLSIFIQDELTMPDALQM